MAGKKQLLRLGTRGSLLARMQSQMVADELEHRHPSLHVELIICKTTGDKIQDRPLHEAGGKGLFTKELEEALLENRVDFAVHSLKDVPVTMPLVDQAGLILAAIPPREDARDVLVCTTAQSIEQLPQGARVGTGSLRRQAQLLSLRPDIVVQGLRGNIDTRVRKCLEGAYDAVILAFSGLRRANLFDSHTMTPIPADQFIPAAGQGSLALQCRSDDRKTRKWLSVLHDANTAVCVDLERKLVQALQGDCVSPIGAYAAVMDEKIRFRAAVAGAGGKLPVLHAEAEAKLSQPDAAFDAVLKALHDQGAMELLHGR